MSVVAPDRVSVDKRKSQAQRGLPDCFGLDRTVVSHNGRWHVFATVRMKSGKAVIKYLNFADWARANQASALVTAVIEAFLESGNGDWQRRLGSPGPKPLTWAHATT